MDDAEGQGTEETDGCVTVGGRSPGTTRKLRSLLQHKDSQKLIEKHANAFRLFRAPNAFLTKFASQKPGLLSGTEGQSRGTTVTDSLSDSFPSDDPLINEQIEKLQLFINYVNEKFSFVQTNQTPDGSFVTNDDYYLENVPVMANMSGTIREDMSLDTQFKIRSKLYQILVDNIKIFSTLKKMLEIHFLRGWSDQEVDGEDRSIMRVLCAHIMIFLVNGTDCHPGFGEDVCNEPGLVEILVCFIREKKNATKENTVNDEFTWSTITLAIQTLYNCSMNDANRDRLRQTTALEASLPFIDSEDHNTGLVALLTVAYLADEKQSEKFMAKKKGPVENLVRRMQEAVRSDDKRDSEAWTATELIKGLGRLALNDANKLLIAECGAVPVLMAQARQDDAPGEQLESMEVLWTLTFDKTLQADGIFNEGLELFQHMAETANNHVCKEAAIGILWNLRGVWFSDSKRNDFNDKAGLTGSRVAEDAQESAPYIMISYQWDSQELILKIKEALETQGYNVWIDLEKMAGSILEAMADAVEGARLVLICCSKKYKDSQNCRAEAEYTFKLKKEFIPLVVEKRYSADGWLGIMLGTKMYYNFTRSEDFESKMRELSRALGTKGKKTPVAAKDEIDFPFPSVVPEKATVTRTSPPKPAPRAPAAPPETLPAEGGRPPSHPGQTRTLEPLSVGRPLTPGTSPSENVTITLTRADLAAILKQRHSSSDMKNWDADRVRIWMEQHSMDKEKLGHLTGPHLHFLRTMKEDAPPVYYKCIKEDLHLTDIDQMAALTNALEEL